MGYAFISYSTKNQAMADSMKMLLTKNGIKSWMAPNDIPAGKKYAQVINTAIKNCDCVILLLSDAAQASPWVPKEIERAVNYRKMIIPVKIDDVPLNDEFELYISTEQIVAVRQIDESLPEIKKILKSVSAACGNEVSTAEPGFSGERENPPPKPHPSKRKTYILIAAVLLVIGLFAFFLSDDKSPVSNSSEHIPFINMTETEEYIYPFLGYNGFSFAKDRFFMENKSTGNLAMVQTATGRLVPGNNDVDIDSAYENLWVISSEESDIVYFLDTYANKLKIYDSMNNLWIQKSGIDLPISSTERVNMCFAGIKSLKSAIIDEDDMYMMVFDPQKGDGLYTQIICVDSGGEFTITDISALNVSELVGGFEREVSADVCPVMGWTTDSMPVLFDLLTGKIIDERFENIYKKYMPYSTNDTSVSPNNKYIIKTKIYSNIENNPYIEITVWNMESGKSVFREKISGQVGTFFDKDSNLLLYKDGSLSAVDLESGDTKVLLTPQYFENNKEFEDIPYSFYYSAKLDLCFWDIMCGIGEEGVGVATVMITDLSGQILYHYRMPTQFAYCFSDTFVGDDFVVHIFNELEESELGGKLVKTYPLKISYSKDKNGVIQFK